MKNQQVIIDSLPKGNRITSYNVCYTKLLREDRRDSGREFLIVVSREHFARGIDVRVAHDTRDLSAVGLELRGISYNFV